MPFVATTDWPEDQPQFDDWLQSHNRVLSQRARIAGIHSYFATDTRVWIEVDVPTTWLATTTNATSYSLGAFTPKPNALLVVFIAVSATSVSTATCAGGSLTWNQLFGTGLVYNSTSKAYAFYAQVGASPSSTTITVSGLTGGSGSVMGVWQITGHNKIKPIAQTISSTGTATTNPSVTFATARNTKNATLAAYGNSLSPAGSTQPSGWTLDANLGYATPTSGGAGGHRATGETATGVTFTNASSSWGMFGIEVNAEDVGFGPPLFVNYPDRVDLPKYHARHQPFRGELWPVAGISLPYTLVDALGSRLLLYWGSSSARYSGGTWTPIVGASTLTQATGANQPTSDTSTYYNSDLALSFDGVNDIVSNGSLPEITTSPAIGNRQRLMAFVFKATTASGTLRTIAKMGPNSVSINADDKLHVEPGGGTDAVSNTTVNDSVTRRVIIVCDDATGVLTLYINRVAQTTTGDDSVNHDWGSPVQSDALELGSDTTNFYPGLVGDVCFAVSAASTPFSSTDLDNVDRALREYVSGPASVTFFEAKFPDAFPGPRLRANGDGPSFYADSGDIVPPPPAPTQFPTSYPDVLFRPPGGHNQPGFALYPVPIVAAPTPTQQPVSYPDVLSRVLFSPAQQEASSASIGVPERTVPLADVDFVDVMRRPTMPASEQLPWTSSPKPERRAPLADTSFPERIPRPVVPSAEQPYVSGEEPAPERTMLLSDVDWPDRIVRPVYAAPEQPWAPLFAPAPERNAPLYDVEYPDRVPRPSTPAAEQPYVTGQPPQPERTMPLADTSFPERPGRPGPTFWHHAFSWYTVTPAAVVAPALSDVEFPERILRPTPMHSRDFFALYTVPILQPPAPALSDRLFPDAVRRPMPWAWQQAYAYGESPRLNVGVGDSELAKYPDAVARWSLAAANQLAPTSEPPRPERTSPLAVAIHPDVPTRPLMRADRQVAWTTSTKPERPVPLLDALGPSALPRIPRESVSGRVGIVPLEVVAPSPRADYPERVPRLPPRTREGAIAVSFQLAPPPPVPQLQARYYPDAIQRLAPLQFLDAVPQPFWGTFVSAPNPEFGRLVWSLALATELTFSVTTTTAGDVEPETPTTTLPFVPSTSTAHVVGDTSTVSTLVWSVDMTICIGAIAKLALQVQVSGVLTDPTTIALQVQAPSQRASDSYTTYTLGANLTHDGVGLFTGLVDCTEAGVWLFKWGTTGTAQGASQGSFYVDDPEF
jgi:hypothetical protein